MSHNAEQTMVEREMLTAYPIEIQCPDISRARAGNTGVDFVHRLESATPGPVVMLNALTHGNEYSGAEALLRLLDAGLRPFCGTWIVSFSNIAAFATFDPAAPDASRCLDTDMNRVWMEERLSGDGVQRELVRARVLRPFVEEADFLLDLHSMHEECEPLLLSAMTDKAFEFAKRVGFPRAIIRDAGHADGKRIIDFGQFSDVADPAVALLVEAGQHWSRYGIETAEHTLYRFLLASGTIRPGDVPEVYRATVAQVEVHVVARCVANTPDVRFTQDWKGMEVIAQAGTAIAYDGGEPVTTPFDDCVLVMPSLRQVKPGVTYVRFGRQRAV